MSLPCEFYQVLHLNTRGMKKGDLLGQKVISQLQPCGWCDEKSRYLSVWVGFLYTLVEMVTSRLCSKRMSR